MKVFFKAIRQYDYDKVKNYLDKKAELANCVAKTPPKKDDGLSPLQVAFKIDALDIAGLLINKGADINYIDNSEIHKLNMPVFHDFLRAFVANLDEDEETYFAYKKMFRNLIVRGVDIFKCNSFGSSSLVALINATDNLYDYNHKLYYDTKQTKYVLGDKRRDSLLESRIKEVYDLFLDEYLKKEKVEIDINKYSRNTGIYEEFKIDKFSMELLNSLLIKKQGSGLKNFENKK